jgi:hypothetical protein
MSNESENRIDLTQFEGIGKWEVEKQPDGSYAIKTGRDNFSLEEAETIAKLPSLIAELKRCYEELDRPKVTIDDWDKEGPCVTVYLEGKEYVGILREYDASE